MAKNAMTDKSSEWTANGFIRTSAASEMYPWGRRPEGKPHRETKRKIRLQGDRIGKPRITEAPNGNTLVLC